jgi:beta-lactamase class A
MSGTLTLKGAVVQNTVPGTVPLSIFFWDHNNKMVLEVKPGEVTPFESIVAQYITVFLSQSAKKYFFPKSITLKPGNVIVFNPTMGRVKTATIFAEGKQVAQFDMVSSSALTDTPDDTAIAAHTDMYMDKVLALAHLHVLLGSTKEAFNADLKSRGIADTATTKKLTKDQFDIVNKGNAAIRLEGTATDEGDQQIYDETAMLCTAVNTRLDRHCQRCASRPVGH